MKKNANKRMIAVTRNGKKSYYVIHDAELFKAVTELSPAQTSGFLNLLSKTMRVTNSLITQFNPWFAASNPIRDIETAYKLSDEEIKQLFSDLDKCENPFSCPHGRPTFIRFSNYEIERMFKRK